MKAAIIVLVLAACQPISAVPAQGPICGRPPSLLCNKQHNSKTFWYFDSVNGECVEDQGCIIPDEDNFETKAECERNCRPRKLLIPYCKDLLDKLFAPTLLKGEIHKLLRHGCYN
ncbi:uncharacterized protein LOC107038318 [Diachasma alloeum]|uniref:uncharacterized protein LOC107038318 n=1 Tax=Diachasma alloeum TaxID=454923 RepID=UPI0007381DB3|nr:uncharacterized protein LOC107038318 [Diachasma alloeum]